MASDYESRKADWVQAQTWNAQEAQAARDAESSGYGGGPGPGGGCLGRVGCGLFVVLAILGAIVGIRDWQTSDDDEDSGTTLAWEGVFACEGEQEPGFILELTLQQSGGGGADVEGYIQYLDRSSRSVDAQEVGSAELTGQAEDGSVALFATPDPGPDGEAFEVRSLQGSFDLFDPGPFVAEVDAPGCTSMEGSPL